MSCKDSSVKHDGMSPFANIGRFINWSSDLIHPFPAVFSSIYTIYMYIHNNYNIYYRCNVTILYHFHSFPLYTQKLPKVSQLTACFRRMCVRNTMKHRRMRRRALGTRFLKNWTKRRSSTLVHSRKSKIKSLRPGRDEDGWKNSWRIASLRVWGEQSQQFWWKTVWVHTEGFLR